MNEKRIKDDSIKSFRFWFMLFGLATIVIVVFFQDLTIASAHTFAGMIFVRQMSLVVKQDQDKTDLKFEIARLRERVDVIDPYKED